MFELRMGKNPGGIVYKSWLKNIHPGKIDWVKSMPFCHLIFRSFRNLRFGYVRKNIPCKILDYGDLIRDKPTDEGKDF